MMIDDRSRTDLHNALANSIGPTSADTLMSMLPPLGWTDVATRRDVETSAALLRTDMADLRTELKTEMADLRTELKTEMADLRTELKTEMAELRTELRTQMADQRADFRRDLAASTRTMVLANVASVMTALGVALAAA